MVNSMPKGITNWGWVEFKVEPDHNGEIQLVLDGTDYTTSVHLSPIIAYRLGSALVEVAQKAGLPTNFVA